MKLGLAAAGVAVNFGLAEAARREGVSLNQLMVSRLAASLGTRAPRELRLEESEASYGEAGERQLLRALERAREELDTALQKAKQLAAEE